MMKKQATLRERTRELMRAEIADAAMHLFVAQGFEPTTVEQIAQSAGISRRSYFRYFSSKDEAFTEGLISVGNEIAAALSRRPADESNWLALRRAFDPLLHQAESDPHAAALGRLMLEHPALQHNKDSTWQTAIARALAQRKTAVPVHGMDAEALAAAATACLQVAQRWWLQSDKQPLSALLDAAMSAVRALA